MPPSDQDGPITCPKCDQPMRHVRAADVTIDQCARCGGFWLDALELERLTAAAGSAKTLDTIRPAAAGAPPRAQMACPRDRSRLINMVALNQPQVAYESCKVCGGMFLDAQELADAATLSVVERLRKVFSF